MVKKIPIGVDDFDELVNPENNFLFVDKSLLIKELIDQGPKVSLITRPRRWGKTLNMSMLQYFFSPTINGQSSKSLFEDLAIATVDNGHYMQYQGEYPALFISFKDVKENSYDDFIDAVRLLIQQICNAFPELETSQKLTDIDQNALEKLKGINKDNLANEIELRSALKTISTLLFKHYNKKIIILIDEYDTPLNAGYNKPHFEKMVDFLKGLFGAALKGNQALEKGVITGILRLSKNRMLSDLNNLTLYSFIESQYSEHFGFFESDVKALLKERDLDINIQEIQRWYNGYRAGNFEELYNPWSVLNCIKNNGQLKSYWIKTGNESLLKEVILASNDQVKEEMTTLLTGNSIECMIDEYISFQQIKEGNNDVLWSLLWALGYLKTVGEIKIFRTRYQCQVKLPNKEIEESYRDIFLSLIDSMNEPKYYESFIKNLALGNISEFTKGLEEFMLVNTSFFDFSHESNYHIMLLALISSLKETHNLHSNKESGLGKPDIVLIPREITNDLGIVLELKRTKINKGAKFYEKLAETGLAQINKRKYEATFKQISHIKRILKVAFVFYGKQFICKTSLESLI